MPSGSSLADLVRRARITRTDDSGTVQRVQVDVQGDPTHEFEHLQPYGLTGVPPVGARTLLLAVGAAWEHLVALVTGHTDRPRDGMPGDVTLYSAHAARIGLRASGVAITGDATIAGSLSVSEAASGSFVSQDGKLVIVAGGVIVSIEEV